MTGHARYTDADDANGTTRRTLLGRSIGAAAALAVPGGLGSIATQAMAATQRPKRGGQLRVAIVGAGAAEQLNPFAGTTPADVNRHLQLWDPLFSSQSQHSLFKPYLAERVEANRTNTVWQITLRDGVLDHRGRQLTAADAVFSLRAVADVKAGAYGSPFANWMNLNTGLRQTGKLTFEMHLDRALGDIASIARDTSSIIAPMDWNSDRNHPVGTGPFEFVSFTPGEQSVFKRNPNYWGQSAYVDELKLISIPDATARGNALVGGEVDAVESFDFLQAKTLAKNPAVKLLNAPSEWTVPFMTRFDKRPFMDKRVRLAAKLSIDRPIVTDSTYFGFADIGNDQFGKNGPPLYYNSSLPQRTYDPEHAKFLLKQAGFPDGITPTLVLAPDSGSQGPEGVVTTAAQIWQQQAKAAGINFQIQQITNLNQFKILNYPFSATWWSPGVPFVYNFFTTASQYNEGWEHSSWDKIFYAALAEPDLTKAKVLWDEVQAQFYAGSGHIIWGHYNLIDGLSPKVRGAYQNTWPLSTYGFRSYWLA